MKEIKVVEYRDNEMVEWEGYCISDKLILDIDYHGLFILEFGESVVQEIVCAEDAIRTHAITLPNGASEVLRDIGSKNVLDMTVRDLALLLSRIK